MKDNLEPKPQVWLLEDSARGVADKFRSFKPKTAGDVFILNICEGFLAQKSELESLREENERLRTVISNAKHASDLFPEFTAEIQFLKEQLKRESECTDFYADANKWIITGDQSFYKDTINVGDSESVSTLENNGVGRIGGKRARETQKLRNSNEVNG